MLKRRRPIVRLLWRSALYPRAKPELNLCVRRVKRHFDNRVAVEIRSRRPLVGLRRDLQQRRDGALPANAQSLTGNVGSAGVSAGGKPVGLSKGALSWIFHQGSRDAYVVLITIYIFAPYFSRVLIGDPVKVIGYPSRSAEREAWLTKLETPKRSFDISFRNRTNPAPTPEALN